MADSYITRLIDTFESNTGRIAMRVVGDDSQIYTFGESLQFIRAIAWRLGESGVEKGDRVALIGENHPCWALAYLAILYHGAVCVPVDPHGEVETLANFLENSEAKLAFISADLEAKFAGEIGKRLDRAVPVVVWSTRSKPGDGGGRKEIPGRENRADLNDWAASVFPAEYAAARPTMAPDDIALLIYTSGTTGTPKGVPLTHGNIIAELTGIDEVLRFEPMERILSLLPLFHAYLQIVNLWVATTVGCEVGYLKELSPAELGTAMKEFKPTILTTVPRLWYMFHKKIFDAAAAKPAVVRALFRALLVINGSLRGAVGRNMGKLFFKEVHESFGGALRVAVSAGSRFDAAVAVDLHRLGFTIVQGYGLTETSGAATATFEEDNRVGSVGRAMRGTEIKIDSPDKDGVGEVLIRGNVVFSGYYKNPSATAEAFTADGWFRSGDLGRIDRDANLYIVGRAKDVIVLPSGKNVHPEDLEAHYLKTPIIEELAVVGIKDPEQREGAEKLAAVVVPDLEYLRQANISNAKEAVRYTMDDLGRELPEYQRVRDYIIRIDPLPRTATRKIKRFELKRAIEAGEIGGSDLPRRTWELTGGDRALLASEVGSVVTSIIRQHAADVAEIHPEMNLEIDLGLDSLERAEAFAAVEMKFNLDFSAEDAARALTVRELINLADASLRSAEAAPQGIRKSSMPPERGGVYGSGGEKTWKSILSNTDDEIPELRRALKNRPAFLAFVFSAYKGFNLLCRVLLRLDVRGIEHLRGMKRPFIVCPNHQSFLDPFVVCSLYPMDLFRNTFHVGASHFFSTRFMRFLGSLLHVVPVDPDTQLMKAMKAGAVGLDRGKVLNIYPEGERSYDGRLHSFKNGAAILATELDLPILPVALDGLYKVWPRRSNRIRLAKVKVRFGEPFYPRDVLEKLPTSPGETNGHSARDAGTAGKDKSILRSENDKHEAVTEYLRNTIAAMIDEMRR
ncbi:MAG: AMP-binding protein [Acidobacteria bacterium]|nr:AMP-binding protein [Acidobacteriota bacterium]